MGGDGMRGEVGVSVGDRVAGVYHGARFVGTVDRVRGHSIRWDVREVAVKLDEVIVTGQGGVRGRVLLHDDWCGRPVEGFSDGNVWEVTA
jgi:hypothetical protein